MDEVVPPSHPLRVYLTEVGEIALLDRDQELARMREIDARRQAFRRRPRRSGWTDRQHPAGAARSLMGDRE